MGKQEDEYATLVDRLAREKANARIPNGKPEHAKALLQSMFRHAQSEVRIFSLELSEQVYGSEMAAAAASFLGREGTSLKILLQRHVDAVKHPMLSELEKAQIIGQLVVRDNADDFWRDAKHFAVMDKSGFRFEFTHDLANAKCEAIANFNEPDTAKSLADAFDGAFSLPQARLALTLPSNKT